MPSSRPAQGAAPRVIAWLRARADNVAVGLLIAMFAAFILQIFSRYVIGQPLGWTLEACLLTWVWIVFWAGGFLLDNDDHVRFDLLYVSVRPGVRTAFTFIAGVAFVAAFVSALPATWDYISFMKIESTSMLSIRFDYVFSVYVLFALAVAVRYAFRAVSVFRRPADPGDGTPSADRSGRDPAP